jgi:hypothetical protein
MAEVIKLVTYADAEKQLLKLGQDTIRKHGNTPAGIEAAKREFTAVVRGDTSLERALARALIERWFPISKATTLGEKPSIEFVPAHRAPRRRLR